MSDTFERLVRKPLAALAAGYEAPALCYLPEEYDGGELRSYCYDHARAALRWRRRHERVREDWGHWVFGLYPVPNGCDVEDGVRYCAVCDEMLDHWLTEYAVEQEIEYYNSEIDIKETPEEAWALLRLLESARENGESLHCEARKIAARAVARWQKAQVGR